MRRIPLYGLPVIATACLSPESAPEASIDDLVGLTITEVISEPRIPGLADADVVWLFTEEDCLSCQRFDYLLRRVQEKRGRLFFVALILGEGRESAAEFFRARRLPAATYSLVDWGGSLRLPALIVVDKGVVTWVQDGEGRVVPEGVTLVQALDLAGARVGAPDSGSHRGDSIVQQSKEES